MTDLQKIFIWRIVGFAFNLVRGYAIPAAVVYMVLVSTGVLASKAILIGSAFALMCFGLEYTNLQMDKLERKLRLEIMAHRMSEALKEEEDGR